MEATGAGKGLTRRNFLEGAVATGIATTLGNIFQNNQAEAAEAESYAGQTISNEGYSFQEIPEDIPESEIVEDIDCDIVVVGAGVSGMAGIMYGAKAGANIHVLEKSPHEGVHRLSVAGFNSQFMIEQAGGQSQSAEDFSKDFLRYSSGFQSKINLVSRYAKDSGKFIDWLIETMKPYGWSLIPFPGSTTTDTSGFWNNYAAAFWFVDDQGNCIPNGSSPNWMKLFRTIAEDNGAQFHFNEPAVRLVRETTGEKRVTSVISKSKIDGSYRRYNASKGILLAAGDFYNDKEMVHKYCPHLEKCITSICEPNNQGDMHKAGLWVGAAMDDYSAGDLFAFENASCNNWVAPEPGDPTYTPLIDSTRGCMWAPAVAGWPVLWVDDGGHRFVNEDQNLFQLAGAQSVLSTPTGMAWSIWDSAWESKFPEGFIENAGSNALLLLMSITSQEELDREVDLGLVQKYDTIDELIDGCGFDKDQFQETLDRYNYLCERGEDLDCYKSKEWLTSIDTPPYYAAHWGVMVTSTRCGLKTDEHGRVMDTECKTIPGLYAAGNNGGNFYGITYPATMGGTGIGHGQFFSWTSVRDMLGEDVIYTEDQQ